jgi:hypothetical protein
MLRCLCKMASKDPLDPLGVDEKGQTSRASSEGSFGETVAPLPSHADPKREVEKMTSAMPGPKDLSNKCILV